MDPCPRVLLTFGDSSGNPSRSKRGYEDSTHYIIVTATMDAREAQRVDAEVEALKAKYFGGINPERVSFHGHRIFHNLIRYTGNRRLAEQKLKEVFKDIVKITQSMNSTINMVVMDKQSPDKNYKSARTVAISWAHASNMIRRTMLNLHPKPIGIIMLDRYDNPTNRTVSRTITQSSHFPTNPTTLTNKLIMPRPIFVNSESCNTVQLIDMIAHIVAKNNRPEVSETFTRLHTQLMPYISHTAHIAPD